jgi:Arc/MetJ family transcription regulator
MENVPSPPPESGDSTITYKALQVVSYGGPIAVAMASIGMVIVALAYHSKVDDHAQGGLFTTGATMIVLGFVEWALARRFHRHEAREGAERLELIRSLQSQHREQLKLLIDNNQTILARAMLQIESVGSEYDHINSMLKELTKESAARSVSVALLDERVRRLGEEVADLLAWRERIAQKLPR